MLPPTPLKLLAGAWPPLPTPMLSTVCFYVSIYFCSCCFAGGRACVCVYRVCLLYMFLMLFYQVENL